MINVEEVWQILNRVMDPEIPVVSIVDMGIVQDVKIVGNAVQVSLTPTFSGCPALELIRRQTEAELAKAGIASQVSWTESPSWSSDRITPEARQKMASIGLMPPPVHAGMIELALSEAVRCPYCGSQDTIQKNEFGPALCRSIYYCNACSQPFERFKPI